MKIIDTRNTAKISNIPRNFATEPETWYDLNIKNQLIDVNDDASFLIDFYWTGTVLADKRILYNVPLSSRFSIFSYADGHINVFTNLLGTQFIDYMSMTILTAGTGLSVGRHLISARVVGTTFYAKLDDNIELSATGIRKNVITFVAPISDAPMMIYEALERNDTTNEILWSYPNIAEKTRLIKKNNILITDGFEPANTAVKSYISTNVKPDHLKSLTVIWGGKFHLPTGTTVQYAQTCYSFGSVADANIWTCIARTGTTLLQSYIRTDSVNIGTLSYDVGDLINKNIVVAIVYDLENTSVKLYVNGLMVESIVDSRINSLYFYRALSLGDVNTAYDLPKTSFLIVFDRALSEDEIKQF